MTLITCKECNATISSQAFQCPRCGYPLRSVQYNINNNYYHGRRRSPKIVGVVIVLVVFILLYVIAYMLTQFL